jgi:multidrug resistance efflux pump
MNLNSDHSGPLPPIPTPVAKRWREFRLQVFPILVFGSAAAAITLLWSQNLAAPMLQGEVEAIRADVASPQAGMLTQLKVTRFQKVVQGEPLAVIMPTDPRVPLDLIQAEMGILRARLEPRLSEQQNATSYERLRLEWLLQKVSLATARVDLARAESEFKRDEELWKAKLISADIYEIALRNRERLQIGIEERTKLITDLDQGLQRLAALGARETSSPTADAELALIKSQEEKLKQAQASLGPITLSAPMDGMVSSIDRYPGENVIPGEPIVVIAAFQSQRIVGYMRQPFPIEPEVGMAVEVRTRSPRPLKHFAQILHVGSQLEPVTNSLAMVRPGQLLDMALPIEVSLPPGLKTRPGELVDLTIRPRK